jgi:hypothetical protein
MFYLVWYFFSWVAGMFVAYFVVSLVVMVFYMRRFARGLLKRGSECTFLVGAGVMGKYT